jgi:hypothetical protein
MDQRKLVFACLMAFISLACLELVSYAGIELYLQRDHRLFHRPLPRPTDEDIRSYLDVHDERFGWAPSANVDPDGSRTTTVMPYGSKTCVSLYGDSFAWGAEVPDSDAPHNQLAGILGCRVATYAFGGYGIDQAVLRHALNEGDLAPIAILVLYPHDILRSLTHNAGFVLRNRTYFMLKPKFVIDDHGELRLKPVPFTTFEQVRAYVDDPDRALADDPFRPGGDLGGVEARFPFSVAALRALAHPHFRKLARAALGNETEISYFFNTDPRASELAVRLVHYFVTNAKNRGQTPIVVILPTKSDMDYQLGTASCQYAPFADRLETRGSRLHCLADYFAKRLNGRNFCELVNPSDCNLHYTAEGYRIMADALAELIGDGSERAPLPTRN